MSKVRLTGSTSGYVEITAPAIAGNNTVTLPSTNGSANQLLKNGATPGVLEYSTVTLPSSNGSANQLLKNGATPGVLEYSTVSIGSAGELDNIASINGGPLAGFRNRIINGDMRIAQRGTSFEAIANGTYSLDRWGWVQTGAMVCTVSQSTDVPNNTFQSSYKADVTTVDTSIFAGDFAQIYHSIEGYNVRDLIGTTFTLSFWVKSPKTGVHCVSFRNKTDSGFVTRSFIKEYTIVAANTWEYKILTVSGGLTTDGTWNRTNGTGVIVGFALVAGSNLHTTADAWQTGSLIATANQVNVMDNTANDFFLTGVQLEPGSVATPFEWRPIGTELALCQRYYCEQMAHAQSASIGTMLTPVYFPVEMRATPETTNVLAGTSSTASALAINPRNTTSAYFQISATGAGGFVIDRLDAYSAEL